MELYEFAVRTGVAVASGAIIGFERQWHHKEAGLRTNTLVCLGACTYMLLAQSLTETSGDITRIVGQIVTGVGFLGAGLIFREGISVHGLSSAATIWCTSAIGVLAGGGYYNEVVVTVLLVVVMNSVLEPVDRWLRNRK